MRKILFGLFLLFATDCFAVTEFITTVITDGGGDYTTLSAWEAAINADLTASSTKVFVIAAPS